MGADNMYVCFFLSHKISVHNQLFKIYNENEYLNDPGAKNFPLIDKQLLNRLLYDARKSESRLDVFAAREESSGRTGHPSRTAKPISPDAENLRLFTITTEIYYRKFCEVVLAWDASSTECDWEVLYRCAKEPVSCYRLATGRFLCSSSVRRFKATDLYAATDYNFQVRSILKGKYGKPSVIRATTHREPPRRLTDSNISGDGADRAAVEAPAAAPAPLPGGGTVTAVGNAEINRDAMLARAAMVDVPRAAPPSPTPVDPPYGSAGKRPLTLPARECGREAKVARSAPSYNSAPRRDCQVDVTVKIEPSRPEVCDLTEGSTGVVVKREPGCGHSTTIDGGPVRSKCIFCPGDVGAEVVFGCGHMIVCNSCFFDKIEVGETKCYACFCSVTRAIKVEGVVRSRSCMLNLRGCSKTREVVFSCGCFKYCKNCAENLHVCFEHRQHLEAGDKIYVDEFDFSLGR